MCVIVRTALLMQSPAGRQRETPASAASDFCLSMAGAGRGTGASSCVRAAGIRKQQEGCLGASPAVRSVSSGEQLPRGAGGHDLAQFVVSEHNPTCRARGAPVQAGAAALCWCRRLSLSAPGSAEALCVTGSARPSPLR